MTATSLVWIASILVMSAAQVAVIVSFVRRVRRYTTPTVDGARCPVAAVVLCLRGVDPFLRECLDRLSAQDYPQFDIWIVLDAPSDPAERVVRDWLAKSQAANVRLTHVDGGELSKRSSLKANALRHAIARLGDEVEVVALVDADTLTHPQWLRQMVAPLASGDVGVVSGNRWYSPDVRRLGSLIRFVYNAFSVVPMQRLQAVWAGSLSMHRRVFAAPGFLRRLRNTASEEAVILETMRRTGLRLVYAYDCFMLNREETSLADCFRFVERQLLWTRLYNANWNATLAGTLLVYANVVCGWLLMLWAIARGQTAAALAPALTLAGLIAFNFFLMEWLHRAVSKRMESSQRLPPVSLTWGMRLRLAAALTMGLSFYTLAAVAASLTRRVRWRGITYAVEPPNGIRMLAYIPYAEERAGRRDSTHSL